MKKRKLSNCRRKPCQHSAPDEVSRKVFQDRIKELREKHFVPWEVSPTEEAFFQLAEGLEKIAGALRDLAASRLLPPAK